MSSSRPTTRLFTKAIQKLQDQSSSSTPRPSVESGESLSSLHGFASAENTQILCELQSEGEDNFAENTDNVNIMNEDGNNRVDRTQSTAEISPDTEARLVARLTESLSQLFEARLPTFPQDMPPRSSRGRRSYRGNNRRNTNRNTSVSSAPLEGSIPQTVPDEERPVETEDLRGSSNIQDINETLQQLHLNNINGSSKRLEMHRWNLQFSGDGTGLYIDEFLKRVEYIAISQNYTFSEVARNLYMFLKGLAASWYFQWVPRNPNASWSRMKKAMEDHFRTAETDCDLEHQLMNRVQHPNETFDQFYNALAELNCRMQNERSDSDLIEIIKRNASSKLTIFIHSSMTNNLPEFLKQCRRAEKAVFKIESQRKNIYKSRVNEINFVDEALGTYEEEEDHVEALTGGPGKATRDSPDHSQLTCFDCKEIGHIAVNCMRKSNRIFCYRCGLDDYVISNCPNCKGKNWKRSGATGSPAS